MRQQVLGQCSTRMQVLSQNNIMDSSFKEVDYARRSCLAAFFCLSALAFAMSALGNCQNREGDCEGEHAYFCLSRANRSLSFFACAPFFAASLSICAM